MAHIRAEPFGPEHLDAAAGLLAESHRQLRQAWPALNPAYEQPDEARQLVATLAAQEAASGAIASLDDRPLAFVLGAPRPDPTWGANVWMEDCGTAGSDPEAMRTAYALAAQRWFDEGLTSHYVVVPATDPDAIDAWFSLSFGLQHVHALREPTLTDQWPTSAHGVTVRRAERRDVAALAELDRILPSHGARAPVFAPVPIPSFEESLAEVEQDIDDSRYATFVAEHEGRVVATATGCSLELSRGNTRMMRPVSAGFLAHAAVLPEARGVGAGRAVAEAVLNWSRQEGYEWIATDWRSTNLEANRTWRSMGFGPTFLRLHRAIT